MNENTTACSVEIGMSYYDIYAQFSDRLIVNRFSCLAWKNDDGSCDVAVFRDGSVVHSIAHFSPDFVDVELYGMSLAVITEPENLVGKTEADLASEYGLPHFDAGSGRHIPTYISQSGKLYFLTILDRNIVHAISELDLATEASRHYDGVRWEYRTENDLKDP